MGEQQNADEALLKLNQDIFGKTGNGTLDFSLASTPDWEHHPNEEVLNVDIHDMDFNAIHVDALRSKNIKPFPTHSSVSNWECQKNRSLFVNAFPECPLLGADYQMYGQDYVFDPETAERFRNECERFQSIELSPEADLALRKLIYGCTEASKKNMYLAWACD